MAKDIRIVLRTVAHLTGLAQLTGYLRRHVSAVGALKAAYAGVRKAAVATFHAVGSAIRGARTAALGLSAALAGSVREFYVWNKEASRAWTMMGVGVAEFSEFRKEVAKLAPELGVAKSELGKGWYQALSAGVDKNNLVAFLRTAGKVSVADGSSIETAIDGVTTVLNAFKIEASKADKVADLMFKTVRYGKTTFGDLASYISQAAPTASALGVGIDQVLAAVATLTKQGVPTATAMVQIRNSMLILNKELGDGWSKTMTLQGALETVARKGGYSAKALTKMFGTENVSGVLALVGRNARMAAGDLAFMRAKGSGLDEAFKKVDSQVGHWPRLWQTLRGYVADVGRAIDENLKPAINFVTKKLEEMRNSGDFSALVDKIGERVRAAVAAAIAGVNTVVDVISKSTVGGLIAGSVAALVDMAVSLLVEGVRALSTVVVALAKIAAAALAAELMKIDLPFRDELKGARESAAKKISSLSPEQRKEFGVPDELFDGRDRMFSPESFKAFKKKRKDFLNSLSLDQAVSIATSSRDADINGAIGSASKSFKAQSGRLVEDAQRIVGDLSRRTGQDVRGLYTGHRDRATGTLDQIQREMEPPEEAAPAAPNRPAARKPLTREERMAQFAAEQQALKAAEETRRKEEADKQRFLRLRSEAGLAQMFGSGASPAMKERSSGAFDEMLVAQKDMLANKFNTTPAAIDSAVQEAKKLLEETEIGAANLLSVLQKIVAVTNNQTAALKNVEEKINNLPLK